MTAGVNCGGGRRTWLTVDVVSARRPLLIYIGGRERGEAKGPPKWD